MHRILKILFFFLTLALFHMPGKVLACTNKNPEEAKTRANITAYNTQSFAATIPACDNDCKNECCHPRSHNCLTEKCSGNCSGNLCNSFYHNLVADCHYLPDFKNTTAVYNSSNANFYYQNPTYSGGFHSIWQPPKIG